MDFLDWWFLSKLLNKDNKKKKTNEITSIWQVIWILIVGLIGIWLTYVWFKSAILDLINVMS